MSKVPDNERCDETVPDGGRSVRLHRCRNRSKAVINGKRLCGVHLRAVEQREQRRRKWEEGWERDKQYEAEVAAFAEESGLDLQPYYRSGPGGGGYVHGKVIISLDELRRELRTDFS